jgi:hypothetical protein
MVDRLPPPATCRAELRPRAGAGLVRLAAKPITRLAAVALLLSIATAMALTAEDPSIAGLRAVVDRAGVLAPLLFVLLYAVAVAAVLPASPFTVSSPGPPRRRSGEFAPMRWSSPDPPRALCLTYGA